MTSSFTPDTIGNINNYLKTANTLFSENYPGVSPERQPVHTCLLYTSDAADE